ncbi:putative peptide maturation dehydrogenase [Novilysobacter erysipheiresistens]
MHGVSPDAIASMAERGLLCSDADDDDSTRLREAEAQLASMGWHPHAAVYHALSRWHAVEGDEGARDHGDPAHLERLRSHAAIHGELPPHFHVRDDAVDHIRLPLEPLDDSFARVLRTRRTTRHFRSDVSLPLADFNRVLYGTFGAIGTEILAPQMVAIKRTSASGGGLHPIEAYPLAIDVEGLAPGLYHYEAKRHALALLEPMTREQARDLAATLTIGQTYFAEAHALAFHVARLDRHHWKYRRHPKAYKAVLLDSGHLSQTFYLLAAERGLGAFYTAAINDADVSDRLRLDPLREIVIGANGLGVPDPSRTSLQLNPEPYNPANADALAP